MKPSQLAARLLRMAAAIEASKTPSRALVARDLKRVLAAVDGDPTIELKSVGLTTDPHEMQEGGWADFNVEAVVNGIPVKGHMSIEIEGRDFEWGIGDTSNLDLLTRLDEETGWSSNLLVKVQESSTWRKAMALYHGDSVLAPSVEA